MIKTSWNVFIQLLKRDLLIFKREYPSKFIDTCVLFFTNIMVFSYFLPQQGMTASYAPFFLVGAIASFGFVEIVGKISVLLADIQGERSISHTLILPIHSWFVFIYIATFWAITSALLSIILFPLGKLLLFKGWDMSTISYARIIPMYISINIFFGFFALWLTGVIKSLSSINSLWLRYIVPIWMFGAYFYSWETAYSFNHLVGYLSFIDPMVFVMEGMRAAALGQAGYLPFWVSFVVLWGFIMVCGFDGIRRLKHRLDCV